MNRASFDGSFSQERPPKEMTQALVALWYDRKGFWDKAHEIAQEIPGDQGSLVHGYLHLKEGDRSNATYWYQKAGRSLPSTSWEIEWEKLVAEFLN
jgi:hypothetical protein